MFLGFSVNFGNHQKLLEKFGGVSKKTLRDLWMETSNDPIQVCASAGRGLGMIEDLDRSQLGSYLLRHGQKDQVSLWLKNLDFTNVHCIFLLRDGTLQQNGFGATIEVFSTMPSYDLKIFRTPSS